MNVTDDSQNMLTIDDDGCLLKINQDYVSEVLSNYVRLVNEDNYEEIIQLFENKVIDKIDKFYSIPGKILSNKTILGIFTDILYTPNQNEFVLKHRQQILILLCNFPKVESVSLFMYENRVVYSILSRYLSYEERDLLMVLRTVLELTKCYPVFKFNKLFYDAIHIKILNIMEDNEYPNVDIYILSSEILVIIYANICKYFKPKRALKTHDKALTRILSLFYKFNEYNNVKFISNVIDVLSYSLELYMFEIESISTIADILENIYHNKKNECLDALVHFLSAITVTLFKVKSMSDEQLCNFRLFNGYTIFSFIEDIHSLISARDDNIIHYFVSTLLNIVFRFESNEYCNIYMGKISVLFNTGSFQIKNDIILLLLEELLKDTDHVSQVHVVEWLFQSSFIEDIVEFCLNQHNKTDDMLNNLFRRVVDISLKANIDLNSIITNHTKLSELLDEMADIPLILK